MSFPLSHLRRAFLLLACLLLVGGSASEGSSGPDIWDQTAIEDQSTLNLLVWPLTPSEYQPNILSTRVYRTDIVFDSTPYPGLTERISGTLFLYDKNQYFKSAVVVCHGNGGHRMIGDAYDLCVQLQLPVLAINGPGAIDPDDPVSHSTGTPGTGPAWMSTVPEIRDSFIYRYVHAVRRSITAMQAIPWTAGPTYGVTGFSAGAWASWLSHKTDRRIVAAAPIAACGDVTAMMSTPGCWAAALLFNLSGHGPDSPNWPAFRDNLDPLVYPSKPGLVLIGPTQDQFFPINAMMSSERHAEWMCWLPNYDHGAYFSSTSYTGQYDSFNNSIETNRRLKSARYRALKSRLTDPNVGWIPKTELRVLPEQGRVEVVAPAVIPAGSTARFMRLWTSMDDSWTYQSRQITNADQTAGISAGEVWSISLPEEFFTSGIAIAETEFQDDILVGSNAFIAYGVVPRVRPDPSGSGITPTVLPTVTPTSSPTREPSATPVPTDTPTPEPTATSSPTPSSTPSPSPTATPRQPRVFAAGYASTRLSTSGGTFHFWAVAEPGIADGSTVLELFSAGQPTGFTASPADSGLILYTAGPLPVAGPLSPASVSLECAFTGTTGRSAFWPYLNVE